MTEIQRLLTETIESLNTREKRDADRDDAEDREKPALGFPDLPQRVFQ